MILVGWSCGRKLGRKGSIALSLNRQYATKTTCRRQLLMLDALDDIVADVAGINKCVDEQNRHNSHIQYM